MISGAVRGPVMLLTGEKGPLVYLVVARTLKLYVLPELAPLYAKVVPAVSATWVDGSPLTEQLS